jgi:GT2 family glycosyltransferase
MRGWLASSRIQRAKWMLMIDSDMVWDPRDVYKLLEVADAADRPIVGGLCFAGGRGTDFYPTVFNLERNDAGNVRTKPVMDYPRDALVKVGGTGAAFMLIHQWVIKEMGEKFAKLANGSPNPYPWFIEGVDSEGNIYGEDTGFCRNAQALGIPIHVHTGVRVGHEKSYIITEELWDMRRSMGYTAPQENGKDMLKLESRDLS